MCIVLRSSRKKNKSFNEVKDLKERLCALPCRNRKMCLQSNDPHVLGMELKIRLAMHSPVLQEISLGSDGVRVQSLGPSHRHVPVYDINAEQDPELICEVKVKRKR